MAISLRLDNSMKRRLDSAAKARGMSTSALIRQCLDQFLATEAQKPTAWELGKDLFGCIDSGKGDLSERAEEIAKEKAHARHAKNHRR